MKWLKKYEELKPYTYKEAGQRLKSMGKFNRGQRLIDYGNLKGYGVYNMWVVLDKEQGTRMNHFVKIPYKNEVDKNIYKLEPLEFTNPNLYFGFLTKEDEPRPKDVEELCNRWFNGQGELGFELSCSFEPYGNSLNTSEIRKKTSGYSSRRIEMFTIKFKLADKSHSRDREYTDMFDKFQKEGRISISISPSKDDNERFYGIFSDRKSAVKFKKMISEALENNYDTIFDIFSTVSSDPDLFEKFIYAAKNIRSNYLYDDELESALDRVLNKTPNDVRASGRWFGDTNIGGVKPYKRQTYPKYTPIEYDPKTGLPIEPEKDEWEDWENDEPFTDIKDESDEDIDMDWSPVKNDNDE